MTHEELLARIDDQEFAYDNLARSLMAVVDLHRPVFAIVDGVKGPEYCQRCAEGRGYASYPCPTIQAIEKELK